MINPRILITLIYLFMTGCNPAIPEDQIMQKYGEDMEKIKSQLAQDKLLELTKGKFELSNDVIGIIKSKIVDDNISIGMDDVYKKYGQVDVDHDFKVTFGETHEDWNSGTATVTADGEELSSIYTIFEYEGHSYEVLFVEK